MGGLALTRENALVFIVVILAWIVRERRTPNVERRTTDSERAVFLAGLAHRPGSRRGAQQLRRRRLLRHDVAVRPESLHRQQPGGRRHLPVAALRPRRAGVRAAGRDRARRARAAETAHAVGGVGLLDRQGARFRHVQPGRVALADGAEGRAAVERDRNGRHREPGSLRGMVAAAAPRRPGRTLRHPRAAGAVRGLRHLAVAFADLGPVRDDAGLRRERRRLLRVRALPIPAGAAADAVCGGRDRRGARVHQPGAVRHRRLRPLPRWPSSATGRCCRRR